MAMDDAILPSPIQTGVDLLQRTRDTRQGKLADSAERLIQRRAAHENAHHGEGFVVEPPALQHRHDVLVPQCRQEPCVGREMRQRVVGASLRDEDDGDRHVAIEVAMPSQIRP